MTLAGNGLVPVRSDPTHVGILLVVTLIWGTTFVATRALVAGDSAALGPGALVFWRFLVAGLALLPFVSWVPLTGRSAAVGATAGPFPAALWLAGLELGVWLWAGHATQAIGIQYTSVTRSAFVTSLNVVFVPTLAVLAGRRVGCAVWAAVGLAIAGAGLLSSDGSAPNVGDLWTLGCAVTYAAYIVRLERFASRFDSRSLTFVQLFCVAALSLPWMAGEATLGGQGWGRWTPAVVASMLYLGVVATLLTTWLQAVGQRGVPGVHASLLYTTEPVFASAIAMVGFGEVLGPQGWAGVALILVAAVGSQVGPMVWGRRRQMGAARVRSAERAVPSVD